MIKIILTCNCSNLAAAGYITKTTCTFLQMVLHLAKYDGLIIFRQGLYGYNRQRLEPFA